MRVVSQDMAVSLKPAGVDGMVGGFAEMFAGVPEVDRLRRGREALQEGPVVGGAISDGGDGDIGARPPDRPSIQAPGTSQPSAFTLSRIRCSASSNAAGHGSAASGRAAHSRQPRQRLKNPNRQAPEIDGRRQRRLGLWHGTAPEVGVDTASYPASGGPKRSRTKTPASRYRDKIRPSNPRLSPIAGNGRGKQHKNSINQAVTLSIWDLHPLPRLHR